MSIRVDKVQLEIEVREHKRDAEIVKLNKELGEAGRKYRSLQNEVDKLADKQKNGAKLTDTEAKKLSDLEKELEEARTEYQKLDQQKTQYVKENKLETMTIHELSQEYKQYQMILKNLDPRSEYYEKTQKYLQALKDRMSELNMRTNETKSSLMKFIEGANQVGFAINSALAIKDRIVQWADQYVQSFAKMDDAMTDVMKYTGQTKAEVEEMNETFKQMTTRTPREELNALAGAAGRLGIQGKKDIEGFVDAADKINVALGDDLGEGAIDQIGKLTMVFGEDKTKGLNGAMLATGSAINVLGANSSANTGFITEFTSSMAGMAVNAKISQTDIMGYASALSQAGIEGQTASGVFAQMITKMFTDPAKFARAAKLDVKAFTDLLKTDANAAILQFLEGLKANGGFDSLAPALKSLKMQGTQAVPVISSLINKMDELKKAQSDARKAYDEGTSIIEEFNNANSSAAAKLEMAKKSLEDVSAELGQKLMPIVEAGLVTSKTVLQVLSAIAGFVTHNIATISRLAIGIGAYTAAVQLATNATKIWAVVTKATPWGLVLGGITAILVAYDKYKTRLDETRKLQEELNKVDADAVNKYSDQSREVKRLDAAMRDERVSLDERRKALDRLKAIIPDYNGMLDEEGRLTRDNKKAIDDYLVSLQKQIKLKAYQDKLQELYARQADQEEAQRAASDKYWSTRQTNTLQSGNSPTMSLMRWLGIGEEATLKRTLDEANKSLADTNDKITTLENRIKGLGGSTISVSDSSPGNSNGGNSENDSSGDNGGSGGKTDKEKAERDKKRKELEAQEKAAYERELLLLRQQYQGRKGMQDEWHQKELIAEQRYLGKISQLRDEYNADESEKMEILNKKLDSDIKEANLREEQRKRNLQEALHKIDLYQSEDEMKLLRQQLDGEIKTQEEFNQKKLESEIKYQKMRLQYLQQGSAEYLAAQKQLLSLELQQQQQHKKEQEGFNNSYQNTNNSILNDHFSQAGSFEEMLRLNDEYRNKNLISEQQYQQNLTAITQEQNEARRQIEQATIDTINQAMQATSQLFQLMQQRETAAVDAKYKKLIAAAKKQGKDTTKLEEQQEAEKQAIKKKYADKQFQLQVLQIIAATAMAIANVWREWAWMPAVAAALTAAAAAQGAIQLATAKMAAEQASGLYKGGYSDEYQEGYTAKGNPMDQAGVIPVHKNEFVANHQAVANPQVRPLLDVIDHHQKIGDIRMLDATRMLEEAYGRGRYRGGYTADVTDQPEDGSRETLRQTDPEVKELLRDIRANTAEGLTVKELRREIRHQERLESNASR